MSGRRSHARFAVHLAADANLRVVRDVHVQWADEHEMLVLSMEPGIIGQRMRVDLIDDPQISEEIVEVLESRPMPVEGGIRHRLRLRRRPAGETQVNGR